MRRAQLLATEGPPPRGSSPPLVALLLLAVYVLSVFVPPAGGPPAPLAPDASLVERLFPGVPGWWTVGRLLCVIAAAVLVARSCRTLSLLEAGRAPATTSADDRVSEGRLWLAFGSAALQAVAAPWTSHFNRVGQVIYIAAFAVPPLLLTTSPRRWGTSRAGSRRAVTVTAAIVTVWLLLRVPAAWRSARAADVLDTWIGLRFLAEAVKPAFNLLSDRVLPGSGSFHLALQGAGLSPFIHIRPSLALAQAAQACWLAVTGIVLGWLAGRLLGVAAAAVATACLLFSPFVLLMLLTPLPLFFGPLVTVGEVALLVKVHDDRSGAALAALGGLAGIAATWHSANLVADLVIGTALWAAWQPPRLPRRIVIIAVLLFGAAAFTGLSDLKAIPLLARSYTRGQAQWVGHEMAGYGQISAASSEYTVEAAIPRPLDTCISALLAPFALPRTPLRALGDTLFDPLGTGLAAIGIAICLRAVRTSWFARLLLAILVLGLLPAGVSSQDRISIIRLLVLPVPMALLAGIAWKSLGQQLEPGLPSTAATSIATAFIAIGGMAVFDWVNPEILPSSWVSVTLEAVASNPPAGGAMVLDHPDPQTFPYWYLDEVMGNIPRRPIAVRVYDRVSRLRDETGDHRPSAEVFFWSPGLEEDWHVSNAICQEWPRAALYTLVDRAGRSRVFAARPEGPGWKPALPAAQWRAEPCGSALPTEATWAADVLDQARTLTAQGRPLDARAVLRAAARQNFCQTDLFEAAAEAILTSSPSARESQEAVYWAQRASQVTRFRNAVALNTLAAAYAAARQFPDAVDAARQARKLAVAQANDALAAVIDRRLREYELALGK